MSSKKLFLSSLFLALTTLFCISGTAQTKTDTIQQKTYDEIKKLIGSAKELDQKISYCEAYIKKAKSENDRKNLIFGYHFLTYYHQDETKLRYADSIIDLTSINGDATYPAKAYQVKGDYYYDQKAYRKSLENYLKVTEYANKYNNQNLIFRSNVNIGNLKRQIGELDEALEIYQENLKLSEANKKVFPYHYHLTAISSLASTYNEKGIIDSAAFYNRYGFQEALRIKDVFHQNHFSANQGVTHYYEGNFTAALDSLEKRIPYYIKNKQVAALYVEELSFIYYYAGASYFQLEKREKGVDYFKRFDTIFEQTRFAFPRHRKAYEELINYYKEKEDAENRLYYVNQLLKYDNVLLTDESYLNKEIIQEYDLPKLKAEKEKLEEIINDQKEDYHTAILLLSAFIIVITAGFIIQFRRRQLYKKRFDEIINNREQKEESKEKSEKKALDLSPETIEKILLGLHAFEQEHQFTSKETTLNQLAKQLDTNPNYLSKVVNHYKETSFSHYLNELRVAYAIDQLKTNAIFKKYTIKAIASEVGFNNAQSFTRAFYHSKGINPSFFIQELKKIQP